MAKKDPKEAYRAFLGDVPTADKRRAEDVQPADKRQTSDVLKRYNIRIAPADWERLQNAAAAEGTSASAIVRRLIKHYLKGD